VPVLLQTPIISASGYPEACQEITLLWVVRLYLHSCVKSINIGHFHEVGLHRYSPRDVQSHAPGYFQINNISSAGCGILGSDVRHIQSLRWNTWAPERWAGRITIKSLVFWIVRLYVPQDFQLEKLYDGVESLFILKICLMTFSECVGYGRRRLVDGFGLGACTHFLTSL
jgi:hypothetical protein